MVILEKELSDRVEAITKDIMGKLVYPVEFVEMDIENKDDVSQPVAMDNGQKKFIIKLDKGLEDHLFENALIRDLIYCQQMSDNAPVLTPKSDNDLDAYQTAMMISSVIMDIDVENKLKSYGMHIDDIDTMRLSDLFGFLKSGMSDYNRELYHILTGLQVALLYNTSSKQQNVKDIIESFSLTDEAAMDLIERYLDILERYGVNDNRSMMRCMRKMAAASGMKGRLLLEYDGKVSEI